MNKINKLLEKFSFKVEIHNIIMGIALIVSLFFVFNNPSNPIALLAACISAGLINIFNGLKTMKDPKRKTMGMSYLMMGIIIIILGIFITNLNK